ncbi:MAG TPA: FtsX-like permease family protein [Streptosporangiaceae bacterium]|nr:FtsX-like permease family protein [Streptosporangiaceae bacterium]
MIRLGLRLAVGGGREAAVRLVLIAAAVAAGSALLLITLAGLNAVNAQNGRYAWLGTGAGPAAPSGAGAAGPAAQPGGHDPLWWRLTVDFYDGRIIGQVDVAATGPHSPVPPGLPALPGPGQSYASPALAALLRSVPPARLGDRYPGKAAGLIGPAGLPSPDSLIIVTGYRPGQLAGLPGARAVTSIQTISPSSCNGQNCSVSGGLNAAAIDLILSTIALGLLFPVLMFIGTATRLSAARREQRFAAMRLTGATPRQVSVLAATESVAAAAAGTAAGFGLFYAVRPGVATVPFTGAQFFASDLRLGLPAIMAVAVGVPAAAAVASLTALRRVRISPLGTSRRTRPPAPRAWRLIPLAAGLAELAFFAITGGLPQWQRGSGQTGMTTTGQLQAFLPGFALVLAGLVIAGPWLTMAGARLLARRARRPAALIAARRLADNPRAGFRAVSGLILTLFVTTVTLGVISTIAANRAARPDEAARATLVAQFTGQQEPGAVSPAARPLTAAQLARLRGTPGVRGLLVVRTDPGGRVQLPDGGGAVPAGLVSCAQLATVPGAGRCPAGAAAAKITLQVLPPAGHDSRSQAGHVWPAATVPPGGLGRLGVQSVAVRTDGTRAAIERARTALELAYPGRAAASTPAENTQLNGVARQTTEEQQLADVIIIASLVIAGCTMATSVAAGLTERQRPFSLLRLTGVPVSTLRAVVGLESAVPLLIVAAVATGAGFLAAQLYLATQLGYSLVAPSGAYYMIVTGGLVAALAIIVSALPLLRKITGPETARNE